MKKMKITVALASVAIAAVSAYSVAALAEPAPSASAAAPTLASQLTRIDKSNLGATPLSQLSALRATLQPVRLDAFSGAVARTEVLSSGRITLSSGTEKVATVKTTRGSVCFIPSTDGIDWAYACADVLLDSGVTYSANRLDKGWFIAGLAADDVSAISITTASGKTSPAALSANTFYWNAPSLSDQPVAINIVRDGEKLVEKTGIPSNLS